jgi:hypothetical protein
LWIAENSAKSTPFLPGVARRPANSFKRPFTFDSSRSLKYDSSFLYMIATPGREARHIPARSIAMSAARSRLGSSELGNMDMATSFDRVAACAGASCRSSLRCVRPGAKGWAPPRAIARRLLSLSALWCALALAGCASHSAQRELKAYPASADAPAHPRAEPRIHQSDRALLASQPAPNCEFSGSDIDTVDPDLWARLKLDYERHCYHDAEMIVRNRLELLQASRRCEIEPVRHRGRFGR